MPARRRAAKTLMSFEQLDAFMDRRVPKSDRFWNRPCEAPLRGNYHVSYSRPMSHFCIYWKSKRTAGRMWRSAEIAAGPDGSTLYVLPRVTPGSALRETRDFISRWQRDRFRWTPYQYGDEVGLNFGAAYVMDKHGTSRQVGLEQAQALCIPAEPPFARMTHAEWRRHLPKHLQRSKRYLAAAELLHDGLTASLGEFGMPFIVQRSISSDTPHVLAIAPPTTSQRSRTMGLRLVLEDHDLRRKCGVSVDYSQRHVLVEGVEIGGPRPFHEHTASPPTATVQRFAWPSPTHAVRGVVDWFLTVGVHIPGPSLC